MPLGKMITVSVTEYRYADVGDSVEDDLLMTSPPSPQPKQ